jgi:hypothetical protein
MAPNKLQDAKCGLQDSFVQGFYLCHRIPNPAIINPKLKRVVVDKPGRCILYKREILWKKKMNNLLGSILKMKKRGKWISMTSFRGKAMISIDFSPMKRPKNFFVN